MYEWRTAAHVHTSYAQMHTRGRTLRCARWDPPPPREILAVDAATGHMHTLQMSDGRHGPTACLCLHTRARGRAEWATGRRIFPSLQRRRALCSNSHVLEHHGMTGVPRTPSHATITCARPQSRGCEAFLVARTSRYAPRRHGVRCCVRCAASYGVSIWREQVRHTSLAHCGGGCWYWYCW